MSCRVMVVGLAFARKIFDATRHLAIAVCPATHLRMPGKNREGQSANERKNS